MARFAPQITNYMTTSIYYRNLTGQNNNNIVKNGVFVDNAQVNQPLITYMHLQGQKNFEKIATIVVAVTTFVVDQIATIVVDQIATIVVAIATIVFFCDNCDLCCDNCG